MEGATKEGANRGGSHVSYDSYTAYKIKKDKKEDNKKKKMESDDSSDDGNEEEWEKKMGMVCRANKAARKVIKKKKVSQSEMDVMALYIRKVGVRVYVCMV